MAFLKNISSEGLSDIQLIQLYKKSGDLDTLGELYQRSMELVYGVCLKYLKHPENAQDAVMNIFEELVEKIRKHEIEYFKGWLYTMAKNHCLMCLRATKKGQTSALDDNFMHLEEKEHLNNVLDKEENFNSMEHCLEKLPLEQKKLIELFYLQGKCYNEIAVITNMEWKKVRSYIQNGRRNLRICMEKNKIKSAV